MGDLNFWFLFHGRDYGSFVPAMQETKIPRVGGILCEDHI